MSETKTTRPYLRELESVTATEASAKYNSLVFMVLLGLLIGSGIAFAYALVKQHFGPGWPSLRLLLPLGIGLSVLAVYFLAGLSWFNYTVITDSTGVTTRGIRNTKTTQWSDVTGVEIPGSGGGLVCNLLLGKKKQSLATIGHSGPALLASIVQHAHTCRIPVSGQLPHTAQSLWTPIPSSIPQEMDWHNPKIIDRHTALSGAMVVGSLLILALYAIYRLGYLEKLMKEGLHTGTAIAGGLLGAFHSKFQTAQSVSIRTDRFEASTLLATVYVPWSEIKSAYISKKNLVLNCGSFRNTVLLPCDLGSDETVRMALAAIRHLRSSANPLPVLITEPLASAAHLVQPVGNTPTVGEDDFVEIRFPVLLAAIPFLPLAVMALVFFLGSNSEGASRTLQIAALVLVPQAIFLFFFARSTCTRVDSRGITKRTLLGTKYISWGEVASYSVQTSSAAPETCTYHLRDAGGSTLIRLNRTNSGGKHGEFNALVDAMLVGVPREEHQSRFKMPFG